MANTIKCLPSSCCLLNRLCLGLLIFLVILLNSSFLVIFLLLLIFLLVWLLNSLGGQSPQVDVKVGEQRVLLDEPPDSVLLQ